MTQSSADPVLEAQTPEDLLLALKDLKNGVIGNTWRKVEVVEDRQLLARLVGILDSDLTSHDEIVSETAVILGALANVGPLTVRPLIVAGTHTSLLTTLHSLSSKPASTQKKVSAHLLRALRNLLVSTADLVWGSLWGVGAEKKVVSTGLKADGSSREEPAGDKGDKEKEKAGEKGLGRGREWRVEAARALSLSFEPEYLDCLMTFIDSPFDHNLCLPVFQLFERLVALPSNCRALLKYQDGAQVQAEEDDEMTGGPDAIIVDRILLAIVQIVHPPYFNFRTHSRLLAAAVSLLAVLTRSGEGVSPNAAGKRLRDEWDEEDEAGDLLDVLQRMMRDAPTPVRISAVHCLTNFAKSSREVKGEYVPTAPRIARVASEALDTISMLLKTEPLEDGIKLSFVLAELVTDAGALQKDAFLNGTTQLLITLFVDIHQAEAKGEATVDAAARAKEAYLLALASLSSLFEPTRAQIAEATPALLPLLKDAVSSPYYGVRASACQLARSLSRTIAILRTSLLDSGVGVAVIETLKEEVKAQKAKSSQEDLTGVPKEDDAGERIFTVQVAATATICNLVTDFSPLRDTIIDMGGVELMCQLAESSFEPLALNALWALKNFTFRAPENIKDKVISAIGYPALKKFIGPATKLTLRIQALKILQNITADSIPTELGSLLNVLGDNAFLSILVDASREGQDMELRETSLYLFSNLALGNERARMALASRVDIVELLSESMGCKSDNIKLPAIKTLRYLVDSNARTHRPRQSMLDLLQPYHLRPRLEELAETSPSLDVSQNALGLLTVIKRGRERVETPSGIDGALAGAESGEGTGSGSFSARLGSSRNAIFH